MKNPQTKSESAELRTSSIRDWLDSSISGLLSLVFHTSLFLIMAFVSYGGRGVEGETTEVLIGVLPGTTLTEATPNELQADDSQGATRAAESLDTLEVTPPVAAVNNSDASSMAIVSPSAAGGELGAFDLGSVAIGGGSMAGGSWDGMIQTLRRNGLDIVITFDSTGSMSGEINEVKQRIGRIGATLFKLVPKTRISICTYRDTGDEYVVRGLPLTNDLQAVENYLRGIAAGGGGDHPEAVQEGLRWAMSKNQFLPRARKVVLLFGDAPPHAVHLKTCLQLAADFNSQGNGVVSTVTCREGVRLPEFVDIAYAGGGEAFLTTDERQIMTQLLVLVFGSKHRDKVLEAFRLLEK